jgi:hypothetical protein
VLSGRAQTVPKAGDGITESIRALHTVRASANCPKPRIHASSAPVPGRGGRELRISQPAAVHQHHRRVVGVLVRVDAPGDPSLFRLPGHTGHRAFVEE